MAATFFQASLVGVLFRDCNANEARFAGSYCYRTLWLHCHLPRERELPFIPPAAFFAQCTPQKANDVPGPVVSMVCDVFDGHIAEVKCAAFSPDGRYVVSGSVDASLKLWDATTSECLRTMRAHKGAINSVAFSPFGNRIVSGSADGTLRVWDAYNGDCVSKLVGHRASVNSVACSPDGKYLLSSSNDGSIKLWSAGHGDCLLTLTEHTAPVTTVAFSADGSQILSGASDQTMRLWDLATGQCLNKVDMGSEVISVAFSPYKRARRVLLGLGDGKLQILDAISGQPVHELSAAVKRSVLGAVFSCDGDAVLSGRKSGELALWSAVTCEKVFADELGDHVNAVAFSGDGQRFIAAAGNRIEIYGLTGAHLGTLGAHWSRIDTVAVASDGQHFLCGTEDEESLLLNLSDAVCVASHREQLILESQDDQAKISVLQSFLLEYSHSKLPITLWDCDLGEHLHTVKSSQALDTTDRKLSANVDRNLESLIIDGDGNCITSIAYSPGRRYVLVGQRNGSVDLWDVDTREHLIDLGRHTSAVASVAFSPDGALGLSICRDDIAKIWDLDRRACVHIIRTLVDEVTAVRFLPGARQMMVAGIAEVAFWDLEPVPTEVLRVRSFGKGSFAWWRPGEPNSLRWTGEAWRWLSILARNRQAGATERYPIEAFIAAGDGVQLADRPSCSQAIATDRDSLDGRGLEWASEDEPAPFC